MSEDYRDKSPEHRTLEKLLWLLYDYDVIPSYGALCDLLNVLEPEIKR